MRLPGKRDRLRPQPAGERARPFPPPPAAPAALPAAAPAPRSARASLLLLALPILGVVLAVVAPGSPPSGPAGPSGPSGPAALTPMVGIDGPLAPPPAPEETFAGSGILAARAGGPVPPAEPVHPGNGFEAYREALAGLPKPGVRAQRQLAQLARGAPRAELGEEATAYLRACGPSLRLLRQAACSSGFERVGAPTDGDLVAPRRLALAALARGRMELRGGAPAMGARWPLFVIKLGHSLRRDAPFMEAQVARSVCRLGEAWLQRSLDGQAWSEAELRWLAGRLRALREGRPASPAASDLPSLPEERREQARASRERLFAAERAALDALARTLEDRRRRSERKGEG